MFETTNQVKNLGRIISSRHRLTMPHDFIWFGRPETEK
jgi:hypothetical protein